VIKRFKKYLPVLLGVVTTVVLITGIAGCKSDDAGAQSTDTATVLTVTKGDVTNTYTMSALKAVTPVTGWGGTMSSTGTISGPYQYKGVTLTELLKAVGGVTEDNAIRVSAKDGYAMTISYRQLTEGNFTIIDSSTGKETTATSTPVVFLAYEEDGKAISDTHGPLRLGILTSNTQVTDGHWWVKWVQKIEVITTQKPWTLKLEGIVSENMDPATFESGSAIGCHGVRWTDSSNQTWEGIPLWYLVGRVDDTNTHKGDAFDYAAAESGYEVQVIAADGYTVKLTSQEVAKNDTILIAYKVDGAVLGEKYWPLRLVGATLSKAQMVGQIATIKLVFPDGVSN